MIGRACDRVRATQHARDTARFTALLPLVGMTAAPAPTYAEVGLQLKLSEVAVKVAVHRLRAAYRQALREEVAATIDPADATAIDAELRELLDVLRADPAAASGLASAFTADRV